MQKLARITRPMIGCKSHILALAIKDYYEFHPYRMNLVFKIHSIMKILRKANNGGILRNYTNLRPKLYCPTRWSSIYDMLTRYKKLHPYLLQMVTDIEDNITLSIGQMRLFTRLLKDMKYFQSVSLHLQTKEDVILSDFLTIFDDILGKYPLL